MEEYKKVYQNVISSFLTHSLTFPPSYFSALFFPLLILSFMRERRKGVVPHFASRVHTVYAVLYVRRCESAATEKTDSSGNIINTNKFPDFDGRERL